MKQLSLNNNNQVTLISKIVLAGAVATSIGLAGATTVHADTTAATTTTTETAPSANTQTDYDYPYVGLPSWQDIDQETNLAKQYDNALTAENENLAEVEDGEAPTHYSAITLSEPETPTPETSNGNTLQPGDELETIDGSSYIVTPSGQMYKAASSLPTWGLFDMAKDEIQADEAAIANDKAEEAAYEQGSTPKASNVAYSSGASNTASTPASQSGTSTSPAASSGTGTSSGTGSDTSSSGSATTPSQSGTSSTTPTTTKSSSLPDSSKSAYPMTRFPQTGNKINYALSAVGIVLMAIASLLTYTKVTGKKLFHKFFKLN